MKLFSHLLVLVVTPLLLAGCGRSYLSTFDELGDWPAEHRPDVVGGIVEGQYVLHAVDPPRPTNYWVTAGESFSDGIFEVEATQISGVANSGFGLLLRVDEETGAFYAFEISADGYVWIGRCEVGCSVTSQPLLGTGWFSSAAVQTGVGATNNLRVAADGPNLVFTLNGQEVGRAFDATLSEGDIGLLVETLGAGEVAVAFDNVSVTPLEE